MAKFHVILEITNPDSGTTHQQLYTEYSPTLERAVKDATFTAKFNWRVSDDRIKCLSVSEVEH